MQVRSLRYEFKSRVVRMLLATMTALLLCPYILVNAWYIVISGTTKHLLRTGGVFLRGLMEALILALWYGLKLFKENWK